MSRHRDSAQSLIPGHIRQKFSFVTSPKVRSASSEVSLPVVWSSTNTAVPKPYSSCSSISPPSVGRTVFPEDLPQGVGDLSEGGPGQQCSLHRLEQVAGPSCGLPHGSERRVDRGLVPTGPERSDALLLRLHLRL